MTRTDHLSRRILHFARRPAVAAAALALFLPSAAMGQTITISSIVPADLNNGKAQIRTEGFSHTRVLNCDLLENPAPKILKEGGKVDVINEGSE